MINVANGDEQSEKWFKITKNDDLQLFTAIQLLQVFINTAIEVPFAKVFLTGILSSLICIYYILHIVSHYYITFFKEIFLFFFRQVLTICKCAS